MGKVFARVKVDEGAQLVCAERGVGDGDLFGAAAVVSEDAVVLDLDVHGGDETRNEDLKHKDRQNLLKYKKEKN